MLQVANIAPRTLTVPTSATWLGALGIWGFVNCVPTSSGPVTTYSEQMPPIVWTHAKMIVPRPTRVIRLTLIRHVVPLVVWKIRSVLPTMQKIGAVAFMIPSRANTTSLLKTRRTVTPERRLQRRQLRQRRRRLLWKRRL